MKKIILPLSIALCSFSAASAPFYIGSKINATSISAGGKTENAPGYGLVAGVNLVPDLLDFEVNYSEIKDIKETDTVNGDNTTTSAYSLSFTPKLTIVHSPYFDLYVKGGVNYTKYNLDYNLSSIESYGTAKYTGWGETVGMGIEKEIMSHLYMSLSYDYHHVTVKSENNYKQKTNVNQYSIGMIYKF